MDLIDRQTLVDHINECFAETDEQTPIINTVRTAIKYVVEQIPTYKLTRSELRRMSIQQEVFPMKRGEWVEVDDDWIKCSFCGKEICYEANYCPNCGADMRGDKND